MSSYQPRDLTAIIASLTPQPEHVVVRLYLPGERPSQQHSLDQIASARANGCTVGGYIWCYPDFDPRQSVRDALALAARAGLTLPILWLDLETYDGVVGPDGAWLRMAADECARLGTRAGIYTGLWYWAAFVGDDVDLSDLPLWLAQYDELPDPDEVALFGSWTRAAAKQYSTAGDLDHDVLRSEYVTV